VLAVSVLGSGIAALDATVVNIALPTIGRDFGTGVAALQWVMNGYTLTLAAFLLIGGSLGDRFGRRKVYLIGTAWFAARIGPGRHHRLCLPAPGRTCRGIPDCGAHIGRAMCRRRAARRRHDHQPGPRASRRGCIRAVPALRPRCAAAGR
jgi:hypothetical protein